MASAVKQDDQVGAGTKTNGRGPSGDDYREHRLQSLSHAIVLNSDCHYLLNRYLFIKFACTYLSSHLPRSVHSPCPTIYTPKVNSRTGFGLGIGS